MRLAKIAALMMTLALLTACGAQRGEEEFEAFRAQLTAAAQTTLTAEVTAQEPDAASDYTLSCVSAPEGCTLTVLAPDVIAGVKAHMTDGSSTLEYDGLLLGLPELTGDGLSPLSALPRILAALRDGYAETIWRQNGCLAAEIKPDDTVTITVWFDDGGVPARAEIASQSDGRVLITCDITEFSME